MAGGVPSFRRRAWVWRPSGAGLIAALLLGWAALAGAADIHQAAEEGDVTRLRALLTASPERVNEPDREGKTPLHFAAAQGQLEAVKLLLEFKADVNARSSSGITPTYLAKGFGKAEVAALLARHGGVTTVQKPAPKLVAVEPKPVVAPTPPRIIPPSALIAAVRSNDLAAVRRAVAASSNAVLTVDAQQWTALHHAVEEGNPEIVKYLLQSGAPVNARALEEVTPLHIAVQRGSPALTALLLEFKADVHARTAIQATPLMLAAARGGAREIVKLLAEAGADLNAKDKYGNTALILSAAAEPDGTAEFLLQRGASVNEAEKNSGFAALHHAVLRGNRPLVEALLGAKADVNAALASGETPLSLALFEERREIAEILRRNGGKTPEQKPLTDLERSLVDQYQRYHLTLATGSFEQVRMLLTQSAPTSNEIRRVFVRQPELAWQIQEKINRDEIAAWASANRSDKDRALMLELVRDGARAGEYQRLTPMPPSPLFKEAQARGWLAPDVPAYALQVTRRGGQVFTLGDYYLVGQRWVIMPALSQVWPGLLPR